MTKTQKIALRRLRRKLEIMRMDQKAADSLRQHDTEEMLALVAIIEKENQ